MLKTKVKIDMHILVPSTHVFFCGNFYVYSYSDACVEKVDKRKIMKLLNCISELISNIDLPEI